MSSTILDRRDCLLGVAGIAVLGSDCLAAPALEPIHAMLKQTVGTRDAVAGMIAVVADQDGTRMTTYGSSGVPGLAMDGDNELYAMSKADGMIRKLTAVVTPPPALKTAAKR